MGTISIAFFNFFGVSVTKSLSGGSRATIDAMRTLFIWLVALRLHWETFQPLQVVGFAVLIAGKPLVCSKCSRIACGPCSLHGAACMAYKHF